MLAALSLTLVFLAGLSACGTPIPVTPSPITTEPPPTATITPTTTITVEITPQMIRGFGGPWILANRLAGIPVQLANGEEIATVRELLFDISGQIQYVVLDTAQLNLREGQVALLAWDDLQFTPPETNTVPILVYPSPRESLTQPLAIDLNGLDQQNLLVIPELLGLEIEDDLLLKASDFGEWSLFDYSLLSAAGEDIGDVENLIIDLETGMAGYIVADVAGFLGVADRIIVVPWNLINYDPAQTTFTVSTDRETIEGAPPIDLNAFMLDGFPENWQEDYDPYWADVKMEQPGGFGGPWILSSALINMPVETPEGQELSRVREVLFGQDGRIRYLILDPRPDGQERVQAAIVPWDLPQFTAATTTTLPLLTYPQDQEPLTAALTVSLEMLEQQTIFVPPDLLGLESGEAALLKASDFSDWTLFDYSLLSAAGEDLGDIEDLILNLETGTVSYMVADVAGYLGLADRLVAVPWNLVAYDAAEGAFTVPVEREAIEGAPAIDLNTIRAQGFQENWQTDNDAYWTTTSKTE